MCVPPIYFAPGSFVLDIISILVEKFTTVHFHTRWRTLRNQLEGNKYATAIAESSYGGYLQIPIVRLLCALLVFVYVEVSLTRFPKRSGVKFRHTFQHPLSVVVPWYLFVKPKCSTYRTTDSCKSRNRFEVRCNTPDRYS